MSTLTSRVIADFTTALATAIAVGGTSFTLQTALDKDGITISSGRYFFALDGSNSNKEHISCTIIVTSGVANATAIKSISRQGVETVGVVRSHRIGTTVSLTDFAHIKVINDLINGTTQLDATTPLSYDGAASITGANQLATKVYVDGVALSGAPDASTTVKGVVKMSTAPVSAVSPIAVGDNDTRLPTQVQKDAMATIVTAPSTTNKFLTQVELPIGIILPYGGATAPTTSWLLAQGQAISRVTYATLFALFGITYGAGDATTTFTLPNLSNNVPVGKGSAPSAIPFSGANPPVKVVVDKLWV